VAGVKIVFVEVVVPSRTAGRDAEATAAQLRDLVPPDETPAPLQVEDEGVMFYYGRPARKLHEPRELPRSAFAVLIKSDGTPERLRRCPTRALEYDQQAIPHPCALPDTMPRQPYPSAKFSASRP